MPPVPFGSAPKWPTTDFPAWMDRVEQWLRQLDIRIAGGGGGGGGRFRIERGSLTFTNVASGGIAPTQTVTFSTPYTEPPAVVMHPTTAPSGGLWWSWDFPTRTGNGFSVRARNGGTATSSQTMDWVAIGATAGAGDGSAPVNGLVSYWQSALASSVATNTFTTITGWVTQPAPYGNWYSGGPGGGGVPGTIVMTVPGFYDITGSIQWAGVAGTTRRIVSIWRNDAEMVRSDVASTPNAQVTQQVNTKVALNPGDLVNIRAWQNTGAGLALAGAGGNGHQWWLTRLGSL